MITTCHSAEKQLVFACGEASRTLEGSEPLRPGWVRGLGLISNEILPHPRGDDSARKRLRSPGIVFSFAFGMSLSKPSGIKPERKIAHALPEH
ncbi:hypothetical protein TNCT_181361 [Trichonephila clavata]|uniref:Uncharacterized protein n=1 Tax=Trichonephila clavata TaxID=2740835 RepID=A0A8X6M4Q3_TRICU|nr:hypothetical protein TNCT_181361 [Trichonephila clavata]